MSFRFTLVLLVVAIVAITGFGIAQKASPPSSGPAPTPTPVLLDLLPSEVTTLDVKAGGRETELSRSDNKWQLSKPNQTPDVDQAKVTQLIGRVATLAGTRSVATAGADLQPYGLNSPSVTATLTGANNKQEVLLIGGKNVNGNQYYAMRQGGTDVALIDSAVVDSLTGLTTNPPLATPAPTQLPTVSPSSQPAPSASS